MATHNHRVIMSAWGNTYTYLESDQCWVCRCFNLNFCFDKNDFEQIWFPGYNVFLFGFCLCRGAAEPSRVRTEWSATWSSDCTSQCSALEQFSHSIGLCPLILLAFCEWIYEEVGLTGQWLCLTSDNAGLRTLSTPMWLTRMGGLRSWVSWHNSDYSHQVNLWCGFVVSPTHSFS